MEVGGQQVRLAGYLASDLPYQLQACFALAFLDPHAGDGHIGYHFSVFLADMEISHWYLPQLQTHQKA